MSKKKLVACEECDGLCCKSVAVEIDEPETEKDWDEIRWYLFHENVIVYKDNDRDWLVEFQTPCRQLDENNKCKVYEKRPGICRKHDLETCQMNGDDEIGNPVFRTIEDLKKYLETQKDKWKNLKIFEE